MRLAPARGPQFLPGCAEIRQERLVLREKVRGETASAVLPEVARVLSGESQEEGRLQRLTLLA